MTERNNYRLSKLANAAEFDEESLLLLLRALNTRRAIAFLGSGISIPYGAMSWNQLVKLIREAAIEQLKRVKGMHGLSTQHREFIETLIQRIKLHSTASETEQAHFTESAERNLTNLELYKLAFDEAKRLDPSLNDFHQTIAILTRTDLIGASQNAKRRIENFCKALNIDLGATKETLYRDILSKVKKVLKALSDIESRHLQPNAIDAEQTLNFQTLYSQQTIDDMRDTLSSIAKANKKNAGDIELCDDAFFEKLNKAIAEDARKAGRDHNEGGFPSDRRSYFCLLWALLGCLSFKLIDNSNKNIELLEASINLNKIRRACSDSQKNMSSLDSAIPKNTGGDTRPRTDPLYQLIDKLSCWRFLTTNYDFEIERLLERLNYPTNSLTNEAKVTEFDKSKRLSARSFLGSEAHSDVFTYQSIAELVDIATHSHDIGAQVMHLHGRADHPDSIIASESDYQDIYLRKKNHKKSFDHALNLVFSGNPLLFIGTSLQEQDLQRSLREFASNKGDEDRNLFALLPSIKGEVDEDATKIEYYLRYGVRVLFYGQDKLLGLDNAKEEKKGNSDNKDKAESEGDVDIAYRGMQIAPLDFGLVQRRKSIDEVREYFRELCIAIENEEPIDLARLKNNDNEGSVYSSLIKALADEELNHEFDIDKTILQQLFNLLPVVLESIPNKQERRKKSKQNKYKKLKPRLLAITLLVLDYLDQLMPKIIGRCLVKAIGDLANDQTQWWTDFHKIPENRITEDLYRYEKQLIVGTRHAIVSPKLNFDLHEFSVKNLYNFIGALNELGATKSGRLFFLQSDRGDGKGSFYHAFIKYAIRKSELGIAQEDSSSHYSPKKIHRKFLFLNACHALEFSSILISFTNFLKCVCLGSRPGCFESDLTSYRKKHGYVKFLGYLTKMIMQSNDHLKSHSMVVLAGFDRLITGNNVFRTVELEQCFKHIILLVKNNCGINFVIMSNKRGVQNKTLQGAKEVSNELMPWPKVLSLSTERLSVTAKNTDAKAFFLDIKPHAYQVLREAGHSEHVIPPPLFYNEKQFLDSICLLDNKFDFIEKSKTKGSKKIGRFVKYTFFWSQLDTDYRSRITWISDVCASIEFEDKKSKLDYLHKYETKGKQVLRLVRQISSSLTHSDLRGNFTSCMMDELNWRVDGEGGLVILDRKRDQLTKLTLAIKVLGKGESLGKLVDVWVKAVAKKAELFTKLKQHIFLKSLLWELYEEQKVWSSIGNTGYTQLLFESQLEWTKTLLYRIDSVSEDMVATRLIGAILSKYGVNESIVEGKVDHKSRIEYLILKQLTYFGFPTEGAVLIRSPEIRAYLTDNADEICGESSKTLKHYIEVFEDSLRRLIDRQLVGVIDIRQRATFRGGSDCSEPFVDLDKGNIKTGPIWLRELLKENTPKDLYHKVSKGYRFVLHPLVKKHLATNLAFRVPEHAYTNTFVMSIYAAQPTDVALLSDDIYKDLDNLLDDLIDAWKLFSITPLITMKEWENPVFDDGSKGVRGDPTLATLINEFLEIPLDEEYLFRAKTGRGLLARSSADMPLCFRAAYGILRQLRPFAVLVRSEPNKRSKVAPKSGYDYSVERIQNLLRSLNSSQVARNAVNDKLEDKKSNIDEFLCKCIDEKVEVHPLNTLGPLSEPEKALYPHEVSWLWNECGVISLAQGKLYDAMPNFRRALKSTEAHEGSPQNGPITERIRLNIAIAEIERGKLRRAREALDNIVSYGQEYGPNEDKGGTELETKRRVIWPLAKGYIALIDHIEGNVASAIRQYGEVIGILEEDGMNRGSCIFRRHLADALYSLGDFEEARQEIRKATNDAQSMMQLDQLHAIRLTRVRLLLKEESEDNLTRAASIIRDVKKRSRDLNLKRLESDALFYDAKLRVLQGEFDIASESAAESVAIATKEGMKLRRIASSLVLGEIFYRNNDRETGLKLIETAGIEAQRIGYQLLVERKHRLELILSALK